MFLKIMTGYRSVENILEEWMKNQDDEEARKRDREILEEHEMRKKKEAEDPNREKDFLGRALREVWMEDCSRFTTMKS